MQENKTHKSRGIYTLVAAFTAVMLVACNPGKQKTGQAGQGEKDVFTQAADTEENLKQRETLFTHLNLSMDDYETANSRCTNNCLWQWWYKSKNDPDAGIYIAIGDIQENSGEGYAEFDESGLVIAGGEEYELEITSGRLSDDGYMDENEDMRSYFFLQSDGEIEFVNLVESPVQ